MPDNSDPEPDPSGEQALAEHRRRMAANAQRAARIEALPLGQRTHAVAVFAAELLRDDSVVTWDAGVGTALHTDGQVTSALLALDDQHFALLDSRETIRLATRLLGLGNRLAAMEAGR